ncbi:hypothetical protein IAT38_003374 [Cryptococcus sp. DSM 104549]
MNTPKNIILATVGTTTAIAIAAVPAVIVTPLLGLAGFSATGPVAGGLAAGAQGAFYSGNVLAGSVFATLQSAAMGGAGAAAVASGATVGAGVVAVGTLGWLAKKAIQGR